MILILNLKSNYLASLEQLLQEISHSVQSDTNGYLQQQKMQPVSRNSFSQSGSSMYRRKTQKKLLDFLVTSFNFSESLANLIIVVHECSDMAQLMSLFILDDDNKYGHIFVPSQSDLSIAKCKVCDQNRNMHVNEITWEELTKFEQQLQNQEQNSQQEQQQKLQSNSFLFEGSQSPPESIMNDIQQNQSIGNEQQKSKKIYVESSKFKYTTCCICYGSYASDDMVHILGVMHEVCLICMGEYLKEEILNLRIQNMACPHCSESLSPDIVKEFVNKTLFEKYQTFSRNLQIQKNPNFKWCPNPKCSVVISINKKKGTAKCPKCETQVCTKCNGVAHPKQSCDEVIRNIYKDLQNASDIQKCKKCKALVEKIAGCNHMTCGICKYEWCWLCGSTYSDIHFSPLNPIGCAGMQNRNLSGFAKCKIYSLRVLMIIGFLILLPVVIPLVMVFCGPVLLFNFLAKKLCRCYGFCSNFLVALLSLPLGIIIDPIVWIGAVIYFIPTTCRTISNWFERRRYMNESSQNQIKRRLLSDKQAEVVVSES